MANVLIDQSILQGWADTIREKTGSEEKMKPAAMLETTKEQWGSGGTGDSDLVTYVDVYTEDGSEVLYSMPVLVNDNAKDPVATGAMDTPTKESTNTQHFAYSGYALTPGGETDASALLAVTERRSVYVAFTASVRYYTVNIYNDTELVETVLTAYGETAIPTVTVTKDGYKINGYEPSLENITEDTDSYIQWVIDDGYIHEEWATIKARCAAGTALSYYKIGDKITIPITVNGATKNYPFTLTGTQIHSACSDITQSTLTFTCDYALDGSATNWSSNSELVYYNYSYVMNFLNDLYDNGGIPTELKNVITKTMGFYNNSYTYYLQPPTSFNIIGSNYNGNTNMIGKLPGITDGKRTLLDGTAVTYWTMDYAKNSAGTKTYSQYIDETGAVKYLGGIAVNRYVVPQFSI